MIITSSDKQYIHLFNSATYKNRSFEDNIYFTLRDLFWNVLQFDDALIANELNASLSKNIPFEERTECFSYHLTKDLAESILDFTSRLEHADFEYDDSASYEYDDIELDDEHYYSFELWWDEFIATRRRLEAFVSS